MSVIKFEIKDEHLKLLKYFKLDKINSKEQLVMDKTDEDTEIVLTNIGNDIINNIGLILYGQPIEFDPFDESTNFGEPRYDNNQISYMLDLYKGLELALDICLYRQEFKIGHYKTKFHLRDWIEYTTK